MNKGMKIAVVLVLLAAVGAVLAVKSSQQTPNGPGEADAPATVAERKCPCPEALAGERACPCDPAEESEATSQPTTVPSEVAVAAEQPASCCEEMAPAEQTAAPEPEEAVTPAPQPLPRLVELGSVTCIPCKMMAPILDELEREYAGRLDVIFHDIRQDRAAAEQYGVRVIPTQVFLDGNGKELWRHEGYISKVDILAKWSELGVTLAATTETPAQ